MWGRKTVIQLEHVNNAIVGAVKETGPWNIEVVDSKLVIAVSNPEKENPASSTPSVLWAGASNSLPKSPQH